MRLRKLLAALVATLSFTGVLAGPAFAGKPFHDGDGSCADLSHGDGVLNDMNGDGVVDNATVEATLATTVCRKGGYIASIYETDGTFITSSSDAVASANDTGGTNLLWQVAVPDRSVVCVVLTSTDMKGKTLDTAPDAASVGCVTGAAISTAPPAGNWQ
jgi:hypothetical protein